MKKYFSRIFKSRIFKVFLVLLVIVSAVALGAAAGYLTTQKSITVKADGSTVTAKNDLYNRLGQNTQDSDPISAPGSVASETTTPNPTKPKPKTTAPKVLACNTSQKTVYTDKYNQDVAAEVARHNEWLQSHPDSDPGYDTALKDENDLYAKNMNSINSAYQASLDSVHC